MDEILTAALINGVAIPIAVAILLTGAVRFCVGKSRGSLASGASIGIAFLVGYALLLTWPAFPPRSSGQKIAYIVLAGSVIGFLIDLLRGGRSLRILAAVIWPAVIVGWLGWRQLTNLSMDTAVPLALLWLAGIFIFERMSETVEKVSSDASVLTLASAIGASLVALIGASGSIAQLYGAVAGATGGFLLWNWPRARFPFAYGALLGGGGALFALAASLTLFSDASRLALAVLLLIFLAPSVARRVPVKEASALSPIAIGVVAIAPVAVAVAIALSIAGDSFELPL